MTAIQHDNRVTRLARWAIRFALRVTSYLAIFMGFMLLGAPVFHVAAPDQWLIYAKLINQVGGVMATLVLGCALLLFGIWMRWRHMRLRQSRNDRAAQRIMEQLRADAAAPVADFYLYLRAFETTGKLRVPLYLRLRMLSLGLLQIQTNDLESYISNAVRRVAPLIALGQPGEAVGAGRIVTEDANWMRDIVGLMHRAKGILLVPSTRPGTLWEIETLKREALLHKVIFIMPPRTHGEFDTAERWELGRQAMHGHALEAPEHLERGLLFAVGADGKVSHVEPLLLNSARQVRKSMKRILRHKAPKGGLYKTIALALRRTRRATVWGWLETLRQLSPYAIAVAALGVDAPTSGFDPGESWSMVFDRTNAMQTMSMDETEDRLLASSEKYLALQARTPAHMLAEAQQNLMKRGLPRLDDDRLQTYFGAFGQMLARVNTRMCAAIARGDIESSEMQVASSYMPPQRIKEFRQIKAEAMLAELDSAEVVPFNEDMAARAGQAFLANLGPTEQQKYEDLDRAQEQLSDDDHCWFVRTVFGSVATLEKPYAGAWARILAATPAATDEER
jgi:hypothetical protein